MRAYTHGGWPQRRVSTTFQTRKKSHNLIFLCSWRGSNLGSLDLYCPTHYQLSHPVTKKNTKLVATETFCKAQLTLKSITQLSINLKKKKASVPVCLVSILRSLQPVTISLRWGISMTCRYTLLSKPQPITAWVTPRNAIEVHPAYIHAKGNNARVFLSLASTCVSSQPINQLSHPIAQGW